jgi:hypothetical protein
MRRIKVFDEDQYDMQRSIDRWMKENPDKNIVQITSSDSSSQHGSRHPILYVLYEDKISAQELLKS